MYITTDPQSDRPKAQKAMEATWNSMEKKEKMVWIKKAAEDQKRYEVWALLREPHLHSVDHKQIKI